MGNGSGWGWVGLIVNVLALAALFAILLTAVVVTTRHLNAGHHVPRNATGARGADDVLSHRFARGEIDSDEYRQRMAALQEHRGR